MHPKQRTGQEMSHRVNKKRRAKPVRQRRIAAVPRNHRLTRVLTKVSKKTFPGVSKNGAPLRSRRAQALGNPKTELEAGTQRFVDLYDFAPIAYVSFNRAGRIEEANLAVTELLGESRDLLIGRPFALYVANLDLFMRHLLNCRTSQQRTKTELQLKSRKGERIPALLYSTPINSTTRNGALLYQTAIVDLTERKNFEEKLRRSEERYRTLFDLVPVAVYTCDADGIIQEYNRRAVELWGGEPGQNGEKPRFCGSYKIYYPDGRLMPHEECPMARLLRGEKLKAEDLEIVVERSNGERRHVIPSPRILTNIHGKITGAINSLFDITQQKQTGRRLAEQARLLDLTNDAIIVRDHQDRIVYWNRGAQQMYGFSAKEALGKITHELLQTAHPENLEKIRKKLARDNRWSGELAHTRKDGETIAVFSRWSLDRDARGRPALILETNSDVTTRRRAEQQQRTLYQFAQLQNIATNVGDIHDASLDAILSAMDCDRASILLFDKEKVMRFVAWRGLSERYRKAVEGHSPWKPDAKSPKPVCINDVDIADIPKPLKSTIRSEGIRAAAFIPLVSSRKLIGKLMIYYDAPHVFTDNELKLATTIATQLAQAIEHKRDEEALRESEARLRATVEQATAGVARCDTNGRIVFANRTLCKMLGYPESELIGQSVADVTYRDDVKKTMRLFQRMIQLGKSFEIEKRYVRKDGSVLWADVSASAVREPNGKAQSTVAVIVDITARKKVEQALQKSNEALEQLVDRRTKALSVTNAELKGEIERRKGLEGEILSVSDREQQRLGQELHDGLCQHLTAVAFMAHSIAMRLKNHRVIDANDIEKIAQLVNDAASGTRDLSRALHRMDVDAAGLVTALQDLVDREIWRTPCRLQVRPSFRINDDTAAAHLYRIAREAVINANKHARAREIVVKLENSRQGMALHVIDDGVGCPNESKLKQGLGFHIMNYRAQLMGGRLKIDSPNGGGTRVSCYLPNHAPGSGKPQENGQVKQSAAKSATAPADVTVNFQHLEGLRAANS
jgi:PAS domain S-box-containing protein